MGERGRKLTPKPNYQSFNIFDINLISIQMKRTNLTFEKPIYCGMSILDISKTLIYDSHLGYIKDVKKRTNELVNLAFSARHRGPSQSGS